ncbi:iron complex transport system ATP-binding protein [Melissococcus plutonius]|nr:iron complex transport system ATP-binding protein [Melissococcus plutonius]
MIELKNVSKKYGEKIVVSKVQMPITDHTLTAFIGPNGAGKSTLLSMIRCLIPKDIGEIYVDHNEIKTWKQSEQQKNYLF